MCKHKFKTKAISGYDRVVECKLCGRQELRPYKPSKIKKWFSFLRK